MSDNHLIGEVFRWNEDELTPRVDHLTADFTDANDVLPVAHPEWFRVGDIVRVGDDDLEDTGEIDEFGNAIMRARNEVVMILSPTMAVKRSLGINPAQRKPQGEQVVIVATATQETWVADDEENVE